MFERCPGHFKQIRQQFNFFVTDDKLSLSSLNNFAVCSLYNSIFRQLSKTNQHPQQHRSHVQKDSVQDASDIIKRYKLVSVICLLTFVFTSARL